MTAAVGAPPDSREILCHDHPKARGSLRRWLVSNHPDVDPCIGGNLVRERIRGNQVHHFRPSIARHRVRYRPRPG